MMITPHHEGGILMKKILLFVLAGVIAVSASGCIPKISFKTKQPTRVEGTVAEKTTEPVVTEAPTKAVQAGIHPGSFVKQGNYKFTFEKAKQYDELVQSEFYTDKPDDGKKYLVLFFEVENVSDEDQHINQFNFDAYEDDYGIDISFILSNPEGYSVLSGDLKPGKKMKGYAAYEVNANWKKLEVTYQRTGDDVKYDFVVTPDDLS